MRLANSTFRTALTTALRAGPSDAGQLAAAAGISGRTVLRILAEMGDSVVATGAARRRRYSLRKPVRGQEAQQPLYVIDPQGRATELAPFSLLHPEGSWCPLAPAWPCEEESRDGLWPGLPYPLYDMRPQGYLGRHLARELHEALAVDADPSTWDDETIVHVLTREGSDCSGNLVLGDAALKKLQAQWVMPVQPVEEALLADHYAEMATGAGKHGVAQSSAAGEFPKFTALREGPQNSLTPHVIVKFSGAGEGETTRRWASLLACEHLAIRHAGTLQGVRASTTRILHAQGRSFLESERFDRVGQHGRLALVSLQTASDHLLGLGTQDWPSHAAGLAKAGYFADGDVQAVCRLWWFGRLIANTDMHLGNLALFVEGGRFSLAPAFDMLPMRYAPLPGGEVPVLPPWQPLLPLPAQRGVWQQACGAALAFWREAAADQRVEQVLREDFANNALALEKVAERV
jgi:hypothetical protein